MRYWSKVEFERLVDEFAILLEIDQGTLECISFREAKVRVGVTRVEAIPHERDISFKTDRDTWGWCTVLFILDLPVDKKPSGIKRRRIWIRKDGERQDNSAPDAGLAAKEAGEYEDGDEDMLGDETHNMQATRNQVAGIALMALKEVAKEAAETGSSRDSKRVMPKPSFNSKVLVEGSSSDTALMAIKVAKEAAETEHLPITDGVAERMAMEEILEEIIPLQQFPPLTMTRQSVRLKCSNPEKSIPEKAV